MVYGSTLWGLTALTAFLQFTGRDFTGAAISEGSPIESLSALGYLMGVILLGFIRKPSSYPYLIVILTLMGFRELDFHNRFTTLSLSKITFYTSPEVPFQEKLLGVILIVFMLYVLVHLAMAHFSDFFNALKRKEPPALGVCFGIGLIVFTKTLDGLARKLASAGIAMSSHLEQLAVIAEEVFELGYFLYVYNCHCSVFPYCLTCSYFSISLDCTPTGS